LHSDARMMTVWRVVVAAALLAGACSSDLKGDAGAGGRLGVVGDPCTQTSCDRAQYYCEFTSKVCAGTGYCAAAPLDCTGFGRPVCGCDGLVHVNECFTNGQGRSDVSDVGGCTPPAGTFACGRFFCAHGTEYCSRLLSPSSPEPGMFQCLSLPGQCGATPTCACVPGNFGFTCTCAASSDGDLTSNCTGP